MTIYDVRNKAKLQIEYLDNLSKQRELTLAESLLLERAIALDKGRRTPRGLDRELARWGIGRMTTTTSPTRWR